jgi:hypothetical protein
MFSMSTWTWILVEEASRAFSTSSTTAEAKLGATTDPLTFPATFRGRRPMACESGILTWMENPAWGALSQPPRPTRSQKAWRCTGSRSRSTTSFHQHLAARAQPFPHTLFLTLLCQQLLDVIQGQKPPQSPLAPPKHVRFAMISPANAEKIRGQDVDGFPSSDFF